MKKKLQIFISSTFSDLQIERQSAVEAILRSGHIPAGMELFSAGSETQLEIIKRWIDESDVYMLILGGRYGSIEKESTLSYTEIEYQYALEKGKPVFAIVVSDNLLKGKVKEFGTDVIEVDSAAKYKLFKELVLSKICRFFNDNNEIKLAIFESLLDIQNRYELKGWVKFEDVPDLSALMTHISSLQEELADLKHEKETGGFEALPIRIEKQDHFYGGLSFKDLSQVLTNRKIIIPSEIPKTSGTNSEISYFSLFVSNSGIFNTGIEDPNTDAAKAFLYKIASELMVFGLIEHSYVKIGQITKSVLKTSTDGMKFIAEHQLLKYKTKPAPIEKPVSIEQEVKVVKKAKE